METSLRTPAFVGVLSTPVMPWVLMFFPESYTVFFSIGYTDSFIRFVDIWNYTTVYTQGTFWADYWFWHLTLALTVISVFLVYLRRFRMGAAFLGLASFALLRFTWGLDTHTSGLVLPVGVPWLLIIAILVYRSRAKSQHPA